MVSTLTLQSPRIWEHAVDTFGTPKRAELWMATRPAELENRTPEEVLLQDPESRDVEAILARIDYGVFG